jgi:hypothetical protein
MVSTYLDLGAASYAHVIVSPSYAFNSTIVTRTNLELSGPLYRLLKASHCVWGGGKVRPPRLQ